MIFTSLGMLVLSACFFLAGMLKSSVALLVVSLVCTAVATILLLGTADLARRRAWSGEAVMPAGAAAPAPGVTPMVVYLPAEQARTAPVTGYDDMTADQVVRLVTSGALTPAQLQAVRDYEAAGPSRKTVLDRVDRALR